MLRLCVLSLYVTVLMLISVYVKFVCVKLLCVRDTESKQEPHTKMWGKTNKFQKAN